MAKAKDTKKTNSSKGKKKSNLPKYVAPEYGVNYIAEALGKSTSDTRVILRRLKIEKDGRSYNFGSKKNADAIVKKCKASTKKSKDN